MQQTHTCTSYTQAFHTFCTWLCAVLLLLEVELVFLTSRCSAGGDSGGVSDSPSSSLSISSSPLIIPTAGNKHYRIIYVKIWYYDHACICVWKLSILHITIYIHYKCNLLPMELLYVDTHTLAHVLHKLYIYKLIVRGHLCFTSKTGHKVEWHMNISFCRDMVFLILSNVDIYIYWKWVKVWMNSNIMHI